MRPGKARPGKARQGDPRPNFRSWNAKACQCNALRHSLSFGWSLFWSSRVESSLIVGFARTKQDKPRLGKARRGRPRRGSTVLRAGQGRAVDSGLRGWWCLCGWDGRYGRVVRGEWGLEWEFRVGIGIEGGRKEGRLGCAVLCCAVHG